MWVPAPEEVVGPTAAGIDPARLTMPAAFDRFAAPPLFICGCARSGTTWTFDLFDRHPEVKALCESWVLSQTRGVTAVLAQPYWDTEVHAGWAERVDMPFGTVQLVSYDQMVRDLGELVAGWLANAAGEDHRFLAAKEPIDIKATAILFPKARFVHVLRDGRDVALSMRRASETWDPTMGIGLPMEFRAEAWRRQVQNIRAHRELLSERYLEVRYEDMQADPIAAMRTLFDFSQIPYDDALLERIREQTDLEKSYDKSVHQSGFRGGSRAGGWREVYSGREAAAFDRAAGELLVELGYEQDRGWAGTRLLARGRTAPRMRRRG
jgi:Sulfotransferase family